MKWSQIKKITACTMAAALILCCGCGNQEPAQSSAPPSETESSGETSEQESGTEEEQPPETQEEQAAGTITYPLEEKVHLTIAMVEEAQVTANASNLDQTPFGQAWQEATGVELEIMQLPDNAAQELLYASGELPDIIYFGGYPGGPEKAIKDKIIEPLNDYMEYAPDLQAVMDSNELYAKYNTTGGGNIIGFPFIRGDEYLCVYSGFMVRQDWLDDLSLDLPVTPDELYDVLKAFKEEKGAAVPLSVTRGWLIGNALDRGGMTSPFGLVKGNFYQVDGKVHYGYAEKEYKDVLVFLNKLYEEGLLDPNFQTLDDNTAKANIMNGDAGVTFGSVVGYLGTMMQTMEEDSDFDLSGFGPLVANHGDIPMSTTREAAVPGQYMVITPNCTNKEAAVKFLNYGYTEEGNMLFNYGIEGVSYTMVDGEPTYTDLIMNNPEGLTKQLAMAQYHRAWSTGPFVQEKRYHVQYADLPQQHAALTSWSTSDAARYDLPLITVAEKDAAEYSKLSGDIDTYISEMTIRYITGLESLDTFESEYLPTLESMNVDRLIELQQQALDDFNAR